MNRITGLVLTYNGERLLDEALASLSFCSEILIIDSGSTDSTIDIARRNNARIVHNPWNGAIEQHRFAQMQINTPWVVTIDQDEIISPELRQNILGMLKNPAPELDGYYCSRRSWYLDRFIMHSGWYPDKLFRIFKHGKITIGGIRPHEELRPAGKAGELDGDIIHYPYENFFQHMDKINEYTQDAAADLYTRGKRGSLCSAIGHGIGKFIKQYILKAGFMDGRAGFIVAIHGFFYTFQKYIRLLELEMKEKIMNEDKPHLIELPKIHDNRGNLTFIENSRHIPFDIKRVYYLYDVPGGETRGGHAHKRLRQYIIAASGSFDVVLDDGKTRTKFSLNRSYYGLYIPTMTWRELENFSSGSVCLVLASEFYDPTDYYYTYEDFMKAVNENEANQIS